ncbi:MAG: hypothetical protein CM15mP32_6250 [Flavobacteriaceae bacterium]|nr:MAG: hypothetical protein CM15mP32_6250 [Flavobacteriaceae bacterium]
MGRGVVISKKAEINLSSRGRRDLKNWSAHIATIYMSKHTRQGNSISVGLNRKKEELNPILNKQINFKKK